jgi:ABC-type uncharacterized transport system substrate-binding protein
MKSKVILLSSAVMAMFFFLSSLAYAEITTKPVLNKGKKWRIGYLESGPFYTYTPNFISLIIGLSELGWIEKPNMPAPKDEYDTKTIWDWLSTDMKSDYLEFPKDAYYNEKYDKDIRNKIKAEVINRLNTKKDIDFMIAMGTWAGQDLANNEHKVPTMIVSVSDAIRSKIVKSVTDSGFDHIHARVDPARYERQVRLFHDIIHFDKLGIAFENTPEGRTIAAIDDAEKVAKEKGFKIVHCFTKNIVSDTKIADDSVINCFEELSKKVDAVYITNQTGINSQNMKNILAPLYKQKIPTFSQVGSDHVKRGVLMCIARVGFKYIGGFHAETMAKIFNGAKPRELRQLFEEPPKISINLAVAKIIGYDPPVDVLGAADEIYEKIEESK